MCGLGLLEAARSKSQLGDRTPQLHSGTDTMEHGHQRGQARAPLPRSAHKHCEGRKVLQRWSLSPVFLSPHICMGQRLK